METEKQIIHIQYYNSPCGEIILASVDNELCLCDWNKMPSAPRNMHRITQHINAVFKIETSPILEQAKNNSANIFSVNAKHSTSPYIP